MRDADVDDLPLLIEMGRAFHEAAQPEWPWDADGFRNTMAGLIKSGFVKITDGGFIAGLIAPMPFSPDHIIAHEVLWWASDNSGARLMRAFRQWAKEQGASEIRWSCRSSNQRVTRFYNRFSQPCEVVFSEYLPCALQQSQP